MVSNVIGNKIFIAARRESREEVVAGASGLMMCLQPKFLRRCEEVGRAARRDGRFCLIRRTLTYDICGSTSITVYLTVEPPPPHVCGVMLTVSFRPVGLRKVNGG